MSVDLSRPGVRRLSLALLAALAIPAVTPDRAAAQVTAYTLDSLLVSVGARASELARSARAVQTISREQILATPARTLADLLRWSNGVDLRDRSPAQADISIRGAGFEEVLVLVDGVRRSDAQTGHFDLDLAVPIDRIERIEILRGPASALYGGDAVGGVINIVTRDAAPGLGMRIEGGSFGAGAAGLVGAARVGEWKLDGGSEFARSDGDRTGTDFDSFVLEGSASRGLGTGRMVLEGGYARRDFGAANFYAPIPAFEKTRTTSGALRWSGAVGSAFGLQARLSARRHEDEFIFFRDEPERGANQHDAHELGAEVVGRWAGHSRFAVVGGTEVFEEVLESSNLGTRSQTRGALFGEIAILTAGGNASLVFGARGDFHDVYAPEISPSVSVSFPATDRVRFRGAIDRSFRPPTWTERYYADGFHQASTEIDPEKAWSIEAGMDARATDGWGVSTSVFMRFSEDLIDWAKPVGSDPEVKWVTRNVDNADFMGIEIEIDREDLLGARWSLGFSALDLKTHEVEDFFSKSALRPETRRLTLRVGKAIGPFDVGFLGLAADRGSEDGYHRVDFRGAVDVGRGQLFLDLTNLTDQDHLDISGVRVEGLGVVAGYRIGLSADPNR